MNMAEPKFPDLLSTIVGRVDEVCERAGPGADALAEAFCLWLGTGGGAIVPS